MTNRYEEDLEEEVVEESFLEDVKKLAIHYVDAFFKNKKYFCGGKIPKKLLHTPRYMRLIFNHDIHNSTDAIYEAIGTNSDEEEMERAGGVPEDVKHLIFVLDKVAHAGVPREFHIGIVVMYLELCEGYCIKL